MRVIFVCMGNICRSPTAEGVFRRYVAAEGHAGDFDIDSAGTMAYHSGEPADRRMRTAAARRGYELDSIARGVGVDDLVNFDLVVAMDRDNFTDLRRLHPATAAKVVMLGRFLPNVLSDEDAPSVPDPYYGGEAGFETVIDMIENACPALLAHCLSLMDRTP